MGVTIHFDGKLIDEEAYSAVLGTALAFASQQSWQHSPLSDSRAKLLRVNPETEEEWDYEGPIKGILIQPHPESEPLRPPALGRSDPVVLD